MADGDATSMPFALVCVMMVLVIADRQVFNACFTPVRETLGVTVRHGSILVSAYQWGYLCTNLPGGRLADKIGGLWVLLGALVVWSAALAMTPLAAQAPSAFTAVFVSRVLFGAASGVALPAAASAIGSFAAPPDLRPTRVTIMFASFNGGAVFGLGSGLLLTWIAWPLLFYGFGCFGIVVAFVATAMFRGASKAAPKQDGPEAAGAKFRNAASNAPPTMDEPLLKSDSEAVMEKGSLRVSKGKFIGQLFALISCHSIINITYALTQYWLPTYFKTDLGLNLAASAGISALPMISMCLAAYACGQVAKNLIANGWTPLSVRRLMMAVSQLGPAVLFLLLTQVTNVALAVTLLVVALGLHACNAAGYHACIQDIAASRAGTILGTTNTIGVLCSSISTIVVGHIVEETGSFNWAFIIASVLYVLCFIIFCAFVRGDKLFYD